MIVSVLDLRSQFKQIHLSLNKADISPTHINSLTEFTMRIFHMWGGESFLYPTLTSNPNGCICHYEGHPREAKACVIAPNWNERLLNMHVYP